MWLFSTLGFFSVVTHHEQPDALIVRARVRADLERLREHVLPDLEIEETPGRDYRFRALVARDEWAHAAERLAQGIDYGNFKSAVGSRQGGRRARVYGEVWAAVYELQRSA